MVSYPVITRTVPVYWFAPVACGAAPAPASLLPSFRALSEMVTLALFPPSQKNSSVDCPAIAAHGIVLARDRGIRFYHDISFSGFDPLVNKCFVHGFGEWIRRISSGNEMRVVVGAAQNLHRVVVPVGKCVDERSLRDFRPDNCLRRIAVLGRNRRRIEIPFLAVLVHGVVGKLVAFYFAIRRDRLPRFLQQAVVVGGGEQPDARTTHAGSTISEFVLEQRGIGEVAVGVVDLDAANFAGIVLAEQKCRMAGIVDVNEGVIACVLAVKEFAVGFCELFRLLASVFFCAFVLAGLLLAALRIRGCVVAFRCIIGRSARS